MALDKSNRCNATNTLGVSTHISRIFVIHKYKRFMFSFVFSVYHSTVSVTTFLKCSSLIINSCYSPFCYMIDICRYSPMLFDLRISSETRRRKRKNTFCSYFVDMDLKTRKKKSVDAFFLFRSSLSVLSSVHRKPFLTSNTFVYCKVIVQFKRKQKIDTKQEVQKSKRRNPSVWNRHR